jgi:hypothetical protein
MPFRGAQEIGDVKVLSTNPRTNRMTFSGNCAKCGSQNTWSEIKPFISVSVPCSRCAQKHPTPFPEELQKRVGEQIQTLLRTYGSLAVWGVTFHSMQLFRRSAVFQDPQIVVVDNASAKQMVELNGNRVHSPAIIGEKRVPAVVVFYPNSLEQISAQLRRLCGRLEAIIDVCDLIHDGVASHRRD